MSHTQVRVIDWSRRARGSRYVSLEAIETFRVHPCPLRAWAVSWFARGSPENADPRRPRYNLPRGRPMRSTSPDPPDGRDPDSDLWISTDAAAISRRDFSRVLGVAALGIGSSIGDASAWAEASPDSVELGPRTNPVVTEDLCFTSATQLAAMLRTKKVSAREVMQAHLAQIERVNPSVNAIVTLVADRAMADA